MSTIKPQAAAEFKPEVDGERFKKAMDAQDQFEMIRLTTQRNTEQLKTIAENYTTMYGTDMVEDLKNMSLPIAEASKDEFRKCIVKRMYNQTELAAMRAKESFGINTKESMLTHVVCTRTPEQIVALKEMYKKLFDKDLEAEVKKHCSGDYEKLLVALLSAGREEEKAVDMDLAKEEAVELYKAGEAKWGTDESAFNKVLCKRSWKQLCATAKAYEALEESDKTLLEAIKSEMGGDVEDAMLTVVKAAQNLPKYYAEEIHKAMKGIGTNDDTLIHFLVERVEIDMKQIQEVYKEMYEKTMSSWIDGDVSGMYMNSLMVMTGNMNVGRVGEKSHAE